MSRIVTHTEEAIKNYLEGFPPSPGRIHFLLHTDPPNKEEEKEEEEEEEEEEGDDDDSKSEIWKRT